MEIWKTITDYPNYQVSNYGNVKNIRFNRILKCTITPYGYKVCTQTYNHNYGNAIEKQTKSRREIVVAIKDDICIIVKIKNNIVVETIK